MTFAQVSSARDEIRIGLQARSDTSLDELVCGSVYVYCRRNPLGVEKHVFMQISIFHETRILLVRPTEHVCMLSFFSPLFSFSSYAHEHVMS